MKTDFLRKEERLSLELKALYKSYGFAEYKLSCFEDYSLYAENSLYAEGEVLTVNAGGKLLALRPDVTLSVVKNVGSERGTKKLFYDEKVYRKTEAGAFAEMRQLGVEVIGDIDKVARAEVVALMTKTLAQVSKNYVLDVSHTGVIRKIMDAMGLTGGERRLALGCLQSKNTHDFSRLFARRENAAAFLSLIGLPEPPSAALSMLRSIAQTVDIGGEIGVLEEICRAGGGKININFSVGGDADYYNGAVFKGYVEGVPRAVLSGGRYDKLLGKIGKRAEALGFALYVGELGKYFYDCPAVCDGVVVYTDETAEAALQKAEELRGQGLKILLSREAPPDFGGRIYRAEEEV